MPIDFNKCEHGSIEHLVINNCFQFDSFNNLLYCLWQVHHLSIHCLLNVSQYIDIKLSSIISNHFKYVFLNLDSIRFKWFEKSVKHFFRSFEVLRLDGKNSYYLIWQIDVFFTVNHKGSVLTYHDLINQLNSSFWIEKQFFFYAST